MTWAMLSDDMLMRLEHAQVSRDARLLYVESLVYSTTALTDGELRIRLSRFTDASEPVKLADELVAAGFWAPLDSGYGIVDYTATQRSREEIELAKAASRERQERHRRHKLGDHSMCLAGSRVCPDGRVTRDRTSDTTGQATPTYPIPSHPKDGEGGRWRRGQAASPAKPKGSVSTAAQLLPTHAYVDAGDGTGACRECAYPTANGIHSPAPIERAS